MGNFDGVHTAHRMLLVAAIRLSGQKKDYHSAVFLFDPPTSQVLYPGTRQLSTLQEKLSIFRQCGIEYAYLADFSALRDMPADQFIQDVLLQICLADMVVCGFNFRFGQGGRGDVALLKQHLGEQHVCMIPPCCMPVDNQSVRQVISSTAIRNALSCGDVRNATLLLGRPYRFSAPVLHGKKLGRKIGIPTINQNPPLGKVLPANGVYITRVTIGDEKVFGVSNVGVHPTVDNNAERNCETHLLNFDRDIYGQTVTIEFLEQLRPEQKFNSVEELQKTILNDIQKAKDYLNIK
jgi:riboflavin kinase/FMN adenylyltransferase